MNAEYHDRASTHDFCSESQIGYDLLHILS